MAFTLLGIVEWSNKNSGFAQVALTGVLVVVGVLGSYLTICALLQAADQYRSQYLPIVVFHSGCVDGGDSPSLTAVNRGAGMALDVMITWEPSHIGNAMPVHSIPKGPRTLSSGEAVEVVLNYDVLSVAIAEAIKDTHDPERFVGRMSARYLDVFGRVHDTAGDLYFDDDAREKAGSCEILSVHFTDLTPIGRTGWRRLFVA